MKRSEVIKELVLLFSYTDNLDLPSSNYINDKDLAMEVLTKLEELGMLPPRNINATFEEQYLNRTLYFWEEE